MLTGNQCMENIEICHHYGVSAVWSSHQQVILCFSAVAGAESTQTICVSVYRMAYYTSPFVWISCDIQSTYPIVVSVGLWLIDCSSALHPSAQSSTLQ